jgi:DNA-binding Lrp family transcriptional regulator
LSKVKNVQEVFTVTGEFDFLVKMKVKDIDDYYKSVEGVARKLGAKGGGLIVTKKFKESTELL